MKLKEIREKETDHIKHELSEQLKHLFTLRTQSVTEKLEDPSQLGKTRRVIARIKTVLRQRDIDAEKSAAAAKQPAAKEVAEKKPVAKKPAAKKSAAKKPTAGTVKAGA